MTEREITILHNLLCLHKIGNITIIVNPPALEPGPSLILTPTTNQNHLHPIITQLRLKLLHKTLSDQSIPIPLDLELHQLSQQILIP